MHNLTKRVLLFLIAAAAAAGQTFSTLWTFSGNYVYGSEAYLVQSTDGNFYGTTNDGGLHGVGTFFKITPAGVLTDLYNFGSTATDGINPSPVVQGPDGNFYGTAQGANGGPGSVFQMTPGGTLTTIYTFSLATLDGANPEGLILGANGNFYGMTNTGGGEGGGTIYQITTAGVVTTLYSFSQTQTGPGLSGTLVQGLDGNFYGTMTGGGQNFKGSVFKLTPAGVFSVLYSFGPMSSNAGPPGTLIQGSDGNFYGTTNPGDSVSGTVYRITPQGALLTLYNFAAQPGNGANPTALIQASDGNFYGLTAAGGSADSGTIFRLTGSGSLTTLYDFGETNGADGIDLLQGANGSLYGTTNAGGAHGQGTIFGFTLPALSPSVPVINSVANAFSNSPTIAPNTWVAIKGSDLAPAGDSRIWQSSDFVGTQMPAALDGVSVSMNGEPAYVYYISGAQLNVLTPPDLATGAVMVTVTNNSATSATFTAQAQPDSLAFFVFNGGPYVVGTHLNGSDLGPTSLFPGSSTPAQPNETIVLYGNGFGNVSAPIVKGSVTQTGDLFPMPTILIGGVAAQVQFAGLVSPGLYQFNVVVPAGASNNDNSLVAQYAGLATQNGVLLTVQSNNPPTVESFTLSSATVTSGMTLQATVTLSSAAPSGGIVVTLGSNSAAVSVPSTVTVPAGAMSTTFTILAGSVSAAQSVSLTASYQGSSAQVGVTVVPGGGSTLPQFSVFNFDLTFLSSTETSTSATGYVLASTTGPGYAGGTIQAAFGSTPAPISAFLVQFDTALLSGQTFSLANVSVGNSAVEDPQGVSYEITSGLMTLTLGPNSAPETGTVNGTFQLTSALGTITGTVTGVYTAQ